ncbi:MAG: YciI family protein [Desulfopila sp.]|jgi:uncharacterized protein YciI|nr:YciI family protein [Desulfopila sp.]
MKFVVRTYDNKERIDIRSKYMQSHLEYLADNAREILVAGSLREKIDSNPIGALWIIESESKKRAIELIESDPFFIHGLRSKYEILHWSKAFDRPASV